MANEVVARCASSRREIWSWLRNSPLPRLLHGCYVGGLSSDFSLFNVITIIDLVSTSNDVVSVHTLFPSSLATHSKYL